MKDIFKTYTSARIYDSSIRELNWFKENDSDNRVRLLASELIKEIEENKKIYKIKRLTYSLASKRHWCLTEFGLYEITFDDQEGPFLAVFKPLYNNGKVSRTFHHKRTLLEAYKACQRDFENKVLECLTEIE